MRNRSSVVKASKMSYLSDYIQEYYADEMSEENLMIGTFLHENPLRKEGGALLDLACGSVPFYWAFFQSNVGIFHALDVRKDSIEYARQVIDACCAGSVEERYIAIARKMIGEGGDPGGYALGIARKFAKPLVHSLNDTFPFPDGSFHEVSSCFGIDHVDTKEELRVVLREARRVLMQGGCLTLVTLCRTQMWKCGEKIGPCLYTTPESLREDLEISGFRVVSLEEQRAVTALEKDQGYGTMIFCRALKE